MAIIRHPTDLLRDGPLGSQEVLVQHSPHSASHSPVSLHAVSYTVTLVNLGRHLTLGPLLHLCLLFILAQILCSLHVPFRFGILGHGPSLSLGLVPLFFFLVLSLGYWI